MFSVATSASVLYLGRAQIGRCGGFRQIKFLHYDSLAQKFARFRFSRCQMSTLAKEVESAVHPETIGRKWVGRWLFGCSGMVFGAVVLGGITRLTESGLSMTDWNLFGKMPPLSTADWQREFEQYKQYPEFRMRNKDMTLEEFKYIWWMEYCHRQWGRILGAFFLFPASYMWYRGWFSSGLKKRMVAFGALIGVQGLLGWYMVKSGLKQDAFDDPNAVPRVSQYRLAAHLGLAFVLYSLFFWCALECVYPAQKLQQVTASARKFRWLAHSTKGWVFFTALSGALVAGLDAGLIYNSFPKMADRWIPTDMATLSPTWKNFLENPTTVQFDHRVLGTISLVLCTAVGVCSRWVLLPPKASRAAVFLAGMGWIQVGLGISTLLLYVPTVLAALHQSGSLLTLSFAIWLTHELKHVKKAVK